MSSTYKLYNRSRQCTIDFRVVPYNPARRSSMGPNKYTIGPNLSEGPIRMTAARLVEKYLFVLRRQAILRGDLQQMCVYWILADLFG